MRTDAPVTRIARRYLDSARRIGPQVLYSFNLSWADRSMPSALILSGCNVSAQ